MEVFNEVLSSMALGDLISGSQNAMMSSSISMNERESSANDSYSETVESSSTSESYS